MKQLLAALAIGVVVLGIILYVVLPKSPANPRTADVGRPIASSNPQSSLSPAATAAVPGRYIAYDGSTLASTPGTKIIFFHASWCPQCRQLEADIKAGSIPDGVTIFKADFDTSQTLRQKYGVTLQTTLVKVGDDGQLIKKYVAYEEPTLAALKRNLLP